MTPEEILAHQAAFRHQQARRWQAFRLFFGGGCLLLILILGFGFAAVWWRDATRPYRVMETRRGPGQITCFVRVPPGTSLSTMGRWTRELEAWERPDRPFVVNFYDGERSIQSFVAQSSGGMITPMRADVPP